MKTKMLPMVMALLLMASALSAVSNNTVVVNYIKPVGFGAESLCIDPLTLTVLIQDELIKTGKFNVLNRHKVFTTGPLQELSKNAEYSELDANLIGLEIKAPLIILGRTRYIGGKAWIQLGLFDAEIQAKIREICGYYDNSRKVVAKQAIPELVRQLVGGNESPKPEEKAASRTVIIDNSKFLKWTIFGIITVSAAILVDKLTSRPSSMATENSNTEIVAKW
jgi:hypothetical protein